MQTKDRSDFPKNELCVCLKIINMRINKYINKTKQVLTRVLFPN